MMPPYADTSIRSGFYRGRNSVHSARTMMLEELTLLMDYLGPDSVTPATARTAVVEQNCLGKRSVTTRGLSLGHLTNLYGLDPVLPVFRGLAYFWKRDEFSRPLCAALCALARDPLLYATISFIQKYLPGSVIRREELEEFIETLKPGRFSPATLKSTAQNINSTWTKTGHLAGRSKKTRSTAVSAPASVAYALYLGHLEGVRGENILRTEYVRALDCSYEKALECAEAASARGWMVLRRVGSVIEVQFPLLDTPTGGFL